jgi:hypothetical protein
MPGDEGFHERLLCVAEKINETAVFEKKEVSLFSEELLF